MAMKSCGDRSPLVSVIWNARDRIEVAVANVTALQAQSYRDFELLLVNDGVSNGLFEAAAAADSRIRLLPRESESSGGSLLAALKQCRGDYVAICPAEGLFTAGALPFAVDAFRENPDAGMVCGENFLVDAHNIALANVDIVTLLLTSCRPFLPAGFFRRKALLDIGIEREGWLLETFELQLCARLVTDFDVICLPRRIVDCSSPATHDDGLPKNASNALDQRLRLISNFFSADGFWGDNEALFLESAANQVGILWEQYLALGQHDIAPLAQATLRSIADRYNALLKRDHRVLRNLHRLFCTRSHNVGILSAPLQKLLRFSCRQTGQLAVHLPYQMWAFAFGIGRRLTRKVLSQAPPLSVYHEAAPPRERMLADFYAIAGVRYEARGQVATALAMWKLAEPLESIAVDSLASQALLRLPSATNGSIAAFQQEWAARHTPKSKPTLIKVADISTARKIRIGYHCAFMSSGTIRYMMQNVFQSHDRTRFEVYGYSPEAVHPDIAETFDAVRITQSKYAHYIDKPIAEIPAIPTDDFVAMVRRDQIDVFVELTGFSMGHRFVAMAQRCAPVQVSFLNHTGSCHVPNVDYVLADRISTPCSDQPYYSENIYRLPSCFFCFDYRASRAPPINPDPPSASVGHVTFGCFGYGGKYNSQMIQYWARLLHRVPNSVLHLQNSLFDELDNRRFISNRFHALGIPRDRIHLAKSVTDRAALLESYNRIDISLDTWPYCGGNTTAESLWMGVPVVTLKGDRFSSRYGASLLTAAGCEDLVAGTLEEYIEIAADLSTNLPKLRRFRQELRRMSVEHGLGDSQRFARDLENAYMEMLNRAATAH